MSNRAVLSFGIVGAVGCLFYATHDLLRRQKPGQGACLNLSLSVKWSGVGAENSVYSEKALDYDRRRLQLLREQAALHGPKTDPEILLEIEDLEQKLMRLDG